MSVKNLEVLKGINSHVSRVFRESFKAVSLYKYVVVNSGVLSVCIAFLLGEPATRLQSQDLQQLIAALLEFMAVCKHAIRVHFRLIGEDQDFHTQLVNGFHSLTADLSHSIPAILSEL
ncbi:hypothetical protein L6164_022860 [Bauhinia variegata]|uniref:Uncharacterized protein n=1 Tax=Bauhinia variegata TaxID=167791 RepID=A0ACB9MIE3_BAUVA|nr:hypothetical protein L6164_022860 [Bauhinia variegata]